MHNIYEAANVNFSYLRLQAHCFFNFKISLMPELHGSPFCDKVVCDHRHYWINCLK